MGSNLSDAISRAMMVCSTLLMLFAKISFDSWDTGLAAWFGGIKLTSCTGKPSSKSDDIYDAFYDEYEKLNAFLHSHSYTANPIACSAANATLNLFKKKKVIENNKKLSLHMKKCFESLNDHPHVSDVRQKGMVLAVELVKNKKI